MSKAKKISYNVAMELAREILVGLAQLDKTEKVVIVGSLRRKVKMVGDIDYQMKGSPSQVREFFWDNGWEAESSGMQRQIFSTRMSRDGTTITPKINIFYARAYCWGAALMHNTGPSRYNIRKRYLVKKKGWLLNQYGLYRPCDVDDADDIFAKDEGGSAPMANIASITEKDIYDAMEWTYCKPEDRK